MDLKPFRFEFLGVSVTQLVRVVLECGFLVSLPDLALASLVGLVLKVEHAVKIAQCERFPLDVFLGALSALLLVVVLALGRLFFGLFLAGAFVILKVKHAVFPLLLEVVVLLF